jgi:hypothetical protein
MRLIDVYDETMMKLEWESASDGLTYSLNQLGKNHEIELLCLCMPNEGPSITKKENFNIKFMEDHDALVKEIIAFNPDKLLINGIGHLFNLYLCANSKFSKIWKAIYYHGGELVDPCYSYVKRILVQTRGQRQRLQATKLPNHLKTRIDIVPFGSNPLLFRPLDVEKKYTTTYQGTFAPIKRNILAAKVMINIEGKHLLFGRPYSQSVVDACLEIQRCFPDKLDVEPIRIPHTQVPAKLNSGLVGFLPGIEGGTRGLSEYTMCGIPIITFADSNSIAEEVARTACGIVVKSPAEVRLAIRNILTSYVDYQKKALAYANQELSCATMHRRLMVALELK